MNGGRECRIEGCSQATREAKPYCPDHVHMNPYVASLISDIASDQEDQEARRVLAYGPIAVSILTVVRENRGLATLSRIIRMTRLSNTDLLRVLEAMAGETRVKFTTTNKGRTIVRLSTKEKRYGMGRKARRSTRRPRG